MDEDRYNTLIEKIYDAALDPVHWDSVIHQLRDEFNSIAAGFFVQTADQQLGGSYTFGLDKSEMEIYGEYYAINNPWFTIPGLMKPGRVLTDRSLELIHKDSRAFVKTEMYQDWCRKQDFRHAMGGSLLDRDGTLLNFTFFRSAVDGHYTDAEIMRYQSICRHLMRAVEINSKMADIENPGYTDSGCLDLLRVGVVFLNKNGRILLLNKCSKTILANKNSIYEKDSLIKTVDANEQYRLDRFIAKACTEIKIALLTLPKKTGKALSLCILPHSERRSLIPAADVSAILFISDHDDTPVTHAAYMVERWKLSPAEAQFALQMLKGMDVKEIAIELGLSQNTSRWYSKQIMQKLGVNRQSEVVLKLMNDFMMFLNTESMNKSK